MASAACASLALVLTLPIVAGLHPDASLPSSVVTAASGGARTDKPAVPVRIEIPAVSIDLPVVSSERSLPGNRPKDYPLCDVAQYWTRYDLPGAPGTTWIYAHAQPGMFLPLFTTSEATDGNGLLGMSVEVQTGDGRLLTYRIDEVRERATNRRIGRGGPASEHRLILQTSTGPPGTIPKLQAAAGLVSARRTDEPAPKAKPRVCSQPATASGGSAVSGVNEGSGSPQATDSTTVAEAEVDASLDASTLLLGSGAVLLGATLFAIFLVRRQP